MVNAHLKKVLYANVHCEETSQDVQKTCMSCSHKLQQKHTTMRNVQTVFMLLAGLGIGLNGEVLGTTLVYLKQRIGINYEEMSRSLAAESVGQIIGQLVAGFVFDKFPRSGNICLSTSLIFGSAITCFIPWSPSLVVLACLHFGNGLSRGVIAGGVSCRIFQLWKEKATFPTHLFHLCGGIGFLLASQIAKPFLPKNEYDTQAVNLTSENPSLDAYDTKPYMGNNTITSAQKLQLIIHPEEHIEYPYLIISIYTLTIGIAFLVLHLLMYSFTKEIASSSSGKSPRDDIEDAFSWRLMSWKRRIHAAFFILPFALLWILGVGVEKSLGRFLFPFVTESELAFTPHQGSNFLMVFWLSFTAGRLFAAVISLYLHPLKLLTLALCLSIASSVPLFSFGDSNVVVIWVCTAAFAVSVGPMFASTMTCLNRYISMTPALVTLAFVCSPIGNIGFTRLTAVLFDTEGPLTLMVILFTYSCSAISIVFIITISVCCCPVATKVTKPDIPSVIGSFSI